MYTSFQTRARPPRILKLVLKVLELANFAIVDSLRIELSKGLNVLTGETGAGKSILIDALSLLIGGRADSSWIRSGADSALIQGIFSSEAGLESAARRLSANSRSTARVDGELITVGELAERLGTLVTLHGQHASQVLLKQGEQRKLLDRLLSRDAKASLERYRTQYRDYLQTQKDLENLLRDTRERARRMDILQFQIDEIDSAKLKIDEDKTLNEEVESLRFAERILQNAGGAVDTLSEAEVNASSLIAAAVKDLEQAGRYNKTLAALANELGDALSSIEAVSDEVSSFLTDFEAEPGRLEQVESRLAAIDALKRKYGDSIAIMLDYREQAAAELHTLQNADANVADLEQKLKDLRDLLQRAADTLSKARQKVAKTLTKAVTKEIRPLGMDNAVFEVEVARANDLNAYGQDEVRYLFSANLGEPPAPLNLVASGGELSRVMLGLNVVTGSDLPVLAFDEVDAGIGGKTARAVGRLLKQLAQDHQVLVVTHLPQVAAFADTQFFVEKEEFEGRTTTRVTKLEPKERELELARMLSGTTSEAAVANAKELLAEARILVT